MNRPMCVRTFTLLSRIGILVFLLGLADMIERGGSTWLGHGRTEEFLGAFLWSVIGVLSISALIAEIKQK